MVFLEAHYFSADVVHSFIEDKRNALLDKLVKPLEEEYDTFEKKKHSELMNQLDIKIIVASYKLINGEFAKLIENNDCIAGDQWGTLRDIMWDMNGLGSENGIDAIVDDATDYYLLGGEEGSKLKLKITKKREEINDEYDRILQMVRGVGSAKRAVEALDELGFDTSAIKGTQSMAVAVLNVNSALLGLPERKDDDVKQS